MWTYTIIPDCLCILGVAPKLLQRVFVIRVIRVIRVMGPMVHNLHAVVLLRGNLCPVPVRGHTTPSMCGGDTL